MCLFFSFFFRKGKQALSRVPPLQPRATLPPWLTSGHLLGHLQGRGAGRRRESCCLASPRVRRVAEARGRRRAMAALTYAGLWGGGVGRVRQAGRRAWLVHSQQAAGPSSLGEQMGQSLRRGGLPGLERVGDGLELPTQAAGAFPGDLTLALLGLGGPGWGRGLSLGPSGHACSATEENPRGLPSSARSFRADARPGGSEAHPPFGSWTPAASDGPWLTWVLASRTERLGGYQGTGLPRAQLQM